MNGKKVVPLRKMKQGDVQNPKNPDIIYKYMDENNKEHIRFYNGTDIIVGDDFDVNLLIPVSQTSGTYDASNMDVHWKTFVFTEPLDENVSFKLGETTPGTRCDILILDDGNSNFVRVYNGDGASISDLGQGVIETYFYTNDNQWEVGMSIDIRSGSPIYNYASMYCSHFKSSREIIDIVNLPTIPNAYSEPTDRGEKAYNLSMSGTVALYTPVNALRGLKYISTAGQIGQINYHDVGGNKDIINLRGKYNEGIAVITHPNGHLPIGYYSDRFLKRTATLTTLFILNMGTTSDAIGNINSNLHTNLTLAEPIGYAEHGDRFTFTVNITGTNDPVSITRDSMYQFTYFGGTPVSDLVAGKNFFEFMYDTTDKKLELISYYKQ